MKMKVLQVYKDYYPPTIGGIERHVNLLAEGLKKRGAEVSVLVSNTRPAREEKVLDGIRVVRAPQLFRLAHAPVNWRMSSLIRRLGSDADIIHFHLPNPTADMAYLFSRVKGPRIIATYHSDIVRQKILNRLYNPFLRRFLDRCHAILATSPEYLDSSRCLREHAEKCHIVPLGINLARFEAGCSPEEVRDIRRRYGPEIILFVGKFRYYKGLDILIRAMRKARGNLVLVGRGPCEARLRRLCSELNLEDRVFFMGEISDEKATLFLKASDVFVLPSTLRSEAFGLAQLEAMACGKPVVSTELSTGTSWVNQHRKTGIIVPPADHEALAASINELMSDPGLREKYGRAGRMRAGRHFSSEQIIDKVLQIYNKTIE